MNRGDLVETVATKTGLTKTQANTVLDVVIDTIQTGVRKDGEVRLVSFGTFKKAVRKARTGVNPRTGESLKIPKKTVAKFTPSKTWEVNKAKPKTTKNTKVVLLADVKVAKAKAARAKATTTKAVTKTKAVAKAVKATRTKAVAKTKVTAIKTRATKAKTAKPVVKTRAKAAKKTKK